jgi:lipoprotein signal peptidase
MLLFRYVTQIPHRLLAVTRTPAADPPAQPGMTAQWDRTRQCMVVLALFSVVVVLDQATKWWAWRYVSGAEINPGGDLLVGRTIGAWYSGPVTGALLDLLDFGLVSIAVWVLTRYRAPSSVCVPGALMIGGWGSNLLDRLGVHYWTAPGSVRGAVDFVHIGDHYYNLADFFIIGCTPLFLLAAAYQGVRALRRPIVSLNARPPARSRAQVRLLITPVVGAGLISVVMLGAAHYGGVNTAPRTLGAHSGRQGSWSAGAPGGK